MTRVATMPMHRTLFDSVARSQSRLAETQQQMATGKKANNFAALGTEAVRTLSARTAAARQDAHAALARQVGTTLALYDAHLSDVESAGVSLKTRLLTAIGTGQSAGLQGAAEEAFAAFRTAMNADEAGILLFGGAQTGQPPFALSTLASAAGVPTGAAFRNDDIRASARLAEGFDLPVGLTASDVGSELFDAFRTIAEAGPIGDVPTPAQMAALQQVVGKLDDGLKTLRSHWAENGRRQAQVETLGERAGARSLILTNLIGENEDADLAAVASQLTLHRTALESSYAVFGRLSSLSLVNFLR